MSQPSEAEADRRRFIEHTAETIRNTAYSEYPGVYPGEDHSWNIERFRDNLSVRFHESTPYDSTFSLIGISPPIANAFRRIMVAEVPTIAIENVILSNNTSVIQDEVLASRLGLIPLKMSKECRNFMRYRKKESEDISAEDTILLSLEVECTWAPDGKALFERGERDPKKLYVNSHVYAHQLTWVPLANQAEIFKTPIVPVNPDILIVKLRPGQQISLQLHCVKGIGADHAKFSPIATAWYRLMPDIRILQPIIGNDARKFARCFPRGVIKLVSVSEEKSETKGSPYEGHAGEPEAVVDDPMKDTVSREVLRHAEFENKVKLGRIADHFIYKVESSGQIESNRLFIEAVKILKAKCQRSKELLIALPEA